MAGVGHIPVRRCVVCGRRAPKRELVRMVLRGQRIEVDTHQRLPGRGAYVCPSPGCIRRLSPRRHGRMFRRAVPAGAWQGLDKRLMAVVAGE